MPSLPSHGDQLLRRVLQDHGIQPEVDALRAHHPDTWEHCRRVARACAELALELHETQPERQALALAGLVHDVGKIGVSCALLDKPGRLVPTERAVIEQHPQRGYAMLERLDHHPARLAVLQHHRHAEQAYPPPEDFADILSEGWAESDVAFADDIGQVIAAVDMFDAMLHRRSYRDARRFQEVEETVRRSYRGSGRILELVADHFRD